MSDVVFKDKWGDRLVVSGEGEGEIFLDANVGGDEVTLGFDHEGAREVAAEIFGRAGGKDGLVRASDVSFNEGVIRLAAVHNKTVEFRYVKNETSAPETRRFVPQSYMEQNGGSFLGPDPDRDGGLRRYRLDRIKGTVSVIA